MKKLILMFTVFSLLTNQGYSKRKRPITGGTSVTSPSLIPFQVLITGTDNGGGAIIAKRWVLTAAHLNTGTIDLYAGVTSRNNLGSGQKRGKTLFKAISSYTGGQTPSNDIALIQVDQDFSFNGNVGMIKLASTTNSALWNNGASLRVSGFGRTSSASNAPLSNDLLFTDVTVTGSNSTTKKITAGGNSGHDSCNGDSGGPLFSSTSGNNILTGIVSLGGACGGGGNYTMVSQFLEFIIKTIHDKGTPDRVCGSTTFENIGILPDGVSFNWSASPANLFTTSSGSGLSFTTSSVTNVSGLGTITLTATTPSGTITATKKVWVGKPDNISITTDGTFSISGNNATICKNLGYCMTSSANAYTYTDADNNNSTRTSANSFSYSGWPTSSAFFTPSTVTVTNDKACFGSNLTGSIFLTISATNACGTNGRSVIFQVNNCGFRVFPNPAKTSVAIEFEEPDKIESIPDLIEIKSEKGTSALKSKDVKAIKNKEKNNPKAYSIIDFDVSDLPRGTYYVHLTFGDKRDKQVEQIRILLTD